MGFERTEIEFDVPPFMIEIGNILLGIGVCVKQGGDDHEFVDAVPRLADLAAHFTNSYGLREGVIRCFVQPLRSLGFCPHHDMVVRAQPQATAKVITMPVMLAKDHVDTVCPGQGHQPVGAVVTVAQKHIPGLQLAE